jgi:hypothetical protein
MLSFSDITTATGGRLGIHDVACPACGPDRRDPANRRRRVLRIWREADDFARYHCARCGASGHARTDLTDNVDHKAVGRIREDHLGNSPDSRTVKRGDSTYPMNTSAIGDDAGRTARALEIWNASAPIVGTPAETYLTGRGLTYAGEALRWHPSCPFGKGERSGCMIGLVRNVFTDEPQAIHRTAIDADGRKIDRKAYGPIAGGAIKLVADADITLALAVAEGVETALAIRNLPNLDNMPVWALISASGLAAFPALSGIESIWIAVDNDDAGNSAAATLAARWQEAGAETIGLRPKPLSTDLNDITRAVTAPVLP